MKFLGSTENKMPKDKNGENVSDIEITEVALVHWNIVNNGCQEDSRVFYMSVLNKVFGSLFGRCPTSPAFLKTFNSKYDESEELLGAK